VNDDCIKNRQHTVLPLELFDEAALQHLLDESNALGDLKATPVNIILPAMDIPIDELISRAYE